MKFRSPRTSAGIGISLLLGLGIGLIFFTESDAWAGKGDQAFQQEHTREARAPKRPRDPEEAGSGEQPHTKRARLAINASLVEGDNPDGDACDSLSLLPTLERAVVKSDSQLDEGASADHIVAVAVPMDEEFVGSSCVAGGGASPASAFAVEGLPSSAAGSAGGGGPVVPFSFPTPVETAPGALVGAPMEEDYTEKGGAAPADVPASFHSFPDEIYLRILAFFPLEHLLKLRLVCRKLKGLIDDDQVLKRVDPKGFCRQDWGIPYESLFHRFLFNQSVFAAMRGIIYMSDAVSFREYRAGRLNRAGRLKRGELACKVIHEFLESPSAVWLRSILTECYTAVLEGQLVQVSDEFRALCTVPGENRLKRVLMNFVDCLNETLPFTNYRDSLYFDEPREGEPISILERCRRELDLREQLRAPTGRANAPVSVAYYREKASLYEALLQEGVFIGLADHQLAAENHSGANNHNRAVNLYEEALLYAPGHRLRSHVYGGAAMTNFKAGNFCRSGQYYLQSRLETGGYFASTYFNPFTAFHCDLRQYSVERAGDFKRVEFSPRQKQIYLNLMGLDPEQEYDGQITDSRADILARLEAMLAQEDYQDPKSSIFNHCLHRLAYMFASQEEDEARAKIYKDRLGW